MPGVGPTRRDIMLQRVRQTMANPTPLTPPLLPGYSSQFGVAGASHFHPL